MNKTIHKHIAILFAGLYYLHGTPIHTEVNGFAGRMTTVEVDSEMMPKDAHDAIVAGVVLAVPGVHPKQVQLIQGAELRNQDTLLVEAVEGKMNVTARIKNIDEVLIEAFHGLNNPNYPNLHLDVLLGRGSSNWSDELGIVEPQHVNQEFLERMRAGDKVFFCLCRMTKFDFDSKLPPAAILEILNYVQNMPQNITAQHMDGDTEQVESLVTQWCEDNSIPFEFGLMHNSTRILTLNLGKCEIEIRLAGPGEVVMLKKDDERIFTSEFTTSNIIIQVLDSMRAVANVLC